MAECVVEIQYVRSRDLDERGHGPYRCTHRGVTVLRDGLPDIDKAVCDIEREHLRATRGAQLSVDRKYHLEPVDQLPA